MKDTEVKRLLYQDSEAFKAGVEIGKREAIEDAYEWIVAHWNDYFTDDEDFLAQTMMDDFRKAMLEEE